jgi:hypothetical protein
LTAASVIFKTSHKKILAFPANNNERKLADRTVTVYLAAIKFFYKIAGASSIIANDFSRWLPQDFPDISPSYSGLKSRVSGLVLSAAVLVIENS